MDARDNILILSLIKFFVVYFSGSSQKQYGVDGQDRTLVRREYHLFNQTRPPRSCPQDTIDLYSQMSPPIAGKDMLSFVQFYGIGIIRESQHDAGGANGTNVWGSI